MLSVGFVSWLLRGEALLSALLSSMPLWRGFDPLVIMMRPKRRDEEPIGRRLTSIACLPGAGHEASNDSPRCRSALVYCR